jgi:hypothetical protein
MSFNWEEIGKTVYGILGVGGYRPIQMWDADGTKTMDPSEAIRFIATKKSNDPDLDSFDVMLIIHDENAASHLDIETPNLTDSQDFDVTYSLKKNIQKNIGDKYGLTINWSKFSHNIKSKDAEDSTAIQESKDISKVYGTTKSSFQRVGESKLIIRHTDPVDESKQGSRWRKIKGVFIETKLGERFSYPHSHVAGARAMARHLSNNGTFVDQIAETIKNMSSDYVNLKRANHSLKKSGMTEEVAAIRESIATVNKRVKSFSGPRGYAKMLESIEADSNLTMSEEMTEYANKLAEACDCVDDDQKEPFNVAARYIYNEAATDDRWARRKKSSQEHLDRMADQLEQSLHILKNNPEALEKTRKTIEYYRSGKAVEDQYAHPDIANAMNSKTSELEEMLSRLQVLSGVSK